jgi:hypothetical protein
MNQIAIAVKDMEQTIARNTMMLEPGYEIEFVADLAVRVMSIDPVTFEYAVTDGNQTFRTYNRNVFVTVLGSELIQ